MLIRLLAGLTDIDIPESRHSFAERLSQWLGWTDAISLSSALNGSLASLPSGARGFPGGAEGECMRVRRTLATAIAEDGALAEDRRRADASAGFAPFRRRYIARQQAMETAIGPARQRLRTSLAARSPALARLAAVDAVMEQALGEQERRLLATVPGWLEKHFERLRQTHPATPDEHPEWLDRFCKDVQAVSLAELEIRLEPIEGLLEALRKSA